MAERTSDRQAKRVPGRATGGVTLWHMLEFVSVGWAIGMAIGVVRATGGGPARLGVAVAIGLLFAVPCPIIIHKVGRIAFNAGVYPLPMYVAAALFPIAWGGLGAMATHDIIGMLGLPR